MDNTKRIFEPEMADYLFQNGATLKKIARDRRKSDATIFYFEENETLYKLLAAKKR